MIANAGAFADPRHELWALLESLCEDRLTSDQAARLETWVLSDAVARRIYRDYLDLHGSLYWDTALSGEMPRALPPMPVRSAPEEQEKKEPGRRVAHQAGVALAVALLLGLAVWWSRGGPPADPALVEMENHANNIAESPPKENPSKPPGVTNPLTPVAPKIFEDEPWPAVAERAPRTGPAVGVPESVASTNTNANTNAGSSAAVVMAINTEIRKGWDAAELSPSPMAEDAEWIRRVYLDVVGHVPPAEEVEEFLQDRRENKRALLVDQLLEDPAYVRHFATVWTNLLVGRSTEREVDRFAVHRFLREGFGRNRPWSSVVSDLVSAEGAAEENGAAGFLLAHLNNEAVPATALTARLFLCQQVQCTQCHHHPFNDSRQSEFWELNSFFKQTTIERRRTKDREGRVQVREVLVSTSEGGPTFYEDRNGVLRPAYPKFGGVSVSAKPHVNRREELAGLLVSSQTPLLARAMVNRTWAQFFGYGFTRPVDDMGPHNQPSHPELLDQLAKAFVQSGYDVKRLVRWICLSDPYQRTSQFGPDNEIDNPSIGETPLFSRAYVRSMTAEQLYDSLLIASKAHLASGSSWDEIQQTRQDWLQQFVTAYETEENDEATQFEGTIPQVLLMMNSDLVEEAVRPKQGTYFSEVLHSPGGDADKIRRLCLAALSRPPNSREMAAALRLLKVRRAAGNARTATVEGLQDVFWAFLNSNEFILVH